MNNQDLTQDSFKTGTSTGATGTICTETSLYTATDNKISFILYISAGDPFPAFPGGNGKGKTTWTRLGLSSDGSKSSFEGVLVPAGTL